MQENEILPETLVEELAVKGKLSRRALTVLQRAGLSTVRDVAAYHKEDARYRTLGGCGLKTRRELNQLIKDAYGSLQKQNLEVRKPQPVSGSWQARWMAETDENGDWEEMELTGVAEEMALCGHFSPYDRRYYAKCRNYAAFIRERNGIPQILADIEQHRWFLQQRQSSLSERRAALFAELCNEIGLN